MNSEDDSNKNSDRRLIITVALVAIIVVAGICLGTRYCSRQPEEHITVATKTRYENIEELAGASQEVKETNTIESDESLPTEEVQKSSTCLWKDELIGFLKEQIKTENQIVDSLNRSLGEIGNPAVRGVLKGISLDSMKHAEMYSSAIGLLTTVQQALTQENLDRQTELVEKHIELEAKLIGKISKKLPSIEDKKVKLLLNAILMDEKRHHELLKKVLEILVRGETITEEDWWDILWKNAPFHGAPGG